MNFSPELYQGESRVIPLTVTDPSDGIPADLTVGPWQILTLEWQVKTDINIPDPPLISKSLAGGGITVAPGRIPQQIKIIVQPADTASLAPGGYMHDVVAVFASGDRVLLVEPSGLTVRGVVNQL